MKNRTRESCTSGSVRDEDGNILIYSARPPVYVASPCAAGIRNPSHYRKSSPPPWINLRRQGGEQLLRFCDFGKLGRRREAFERGGEDVVGFERTADRMMELRQRQRRT